MLPTDWASSGDHPRRFDMTTQRAELQARYESFGASKQLRNLLEDLDALKATHALVEAPYVDWDYRAEFSQLYSREFNPPSDKAERLLFFAGEKFLGFAVMRPMPKPVGRTALAPPPRIAHAEQAASRSTRYGQLASDITYRPIRFSARTVSTGDARTRRSGRSRAITTYDTAPPGTPSQLSWRAPERAKR